MVKAGGNEFGLCDPVPALLADTDLDAGLRGHGLRIRARIAALEDRHAPGLGLKDRHASRPDSRSGSSSLEARGASLRDLARVPLKIS